jgi:hypothetical protein
MDKTTEIFTKEVSMISTKGASVSAPNTMIITTGLGVSVLAGAERCAISGAGKASIRKKSLRIMAV